MTGAAPGPAAATVPYTGGPAPAGAGQPPPRSRERALRGGAQAGHGAPAGQGPQEGTAAPSRRPQPASHPRSFETCPALFRLSGMEGGGAQEDSALGTVVSAEQCPRQVLATPIPSPAASPFLRLAAANRGDHGCVRVGPPRAALGAEPGTWQPRPERPLLRKDEIIAEQGTRLPTRGLNARRQRAGGPPLGCPRANSVSPPPPPSCFRAGCRRRHAVQARRKPGPKLLGDT